VNDYQDLLDLIRWGSDGGPEPDSQDNIGCPQCGTCDWDYPGLPPRAVCAAGHAFNRAADLPGTAIRPGYPGDVNDPERWPDDNAEAS